MGIQAQTVPQRTRTSKYQFGEDDVKATLDLLSKGERPGESGFQTSGTARSAANALIVALGKDGAEVGSSVWCDNPEAAEDKQTFSYALKMGKRKTAKGGRPE